MTQQQIDFVKNNYGRMKYGEILNKLGISKHQFYKIIKKTGMKADNNTWTDEQREYLIKNYNLMTKIQISEHIGKNYDSVKSMAQRIGLQTKRKYKSVHGSMNISKTLCWKCAKATDCRKCSWVNDFTPVPGWEATSSTMYEGTPSESISYCVKKCPNFERDKRC